jgi:hypothetical protein
MSTIAKMPSTSCFFIKVTYGMVAFTTQVFLLGAIGTMTAAPKLLALTFTQMQ